MKKFWFVIIAGVAIMIGLPAMVYAIDYQGEYEGNVSFTISSSELGVVDVTEVQSSFKSMDIFSFWDTFKGHSAADRSDFYLVFVEIVHLTSGNTVTENQYLEVPVGESRLMSFTLFELSPGASNLRIYVQSMLTQSIILDQSTSTTVG
jgi:hypothetical protein